MSTLTAPVVEESATQPRWLRSERSERLETTARHPAETIPQAAALRERRGVPQLGTWATLSVCDCTTAGTTTRTVPNLT